jgi:hypothetical protein
MIILGKVTICAFDSDDFLKYKKRLCEEYLLLSGVWVWRVINFHFDDTCEEGLALWNQQDWLISGEFGTIEKSKASGLGNSCEADEVLEAKKSQLGCDC